MSKTSKKENGPPSNETEDSKSVPETKESSFKAFDKETFANRDPDPVIVRRIRELIRSLKKSQSQFANKIDYSEGHLSSVLNGRNKVNDKLIERIVLNLGINPKWILSGKGPMYNSEEKIIMALLTELAPKMKQEDVEFIKKLLEEDFEDRLIFYKFFK